MLHAGNSMSGMDTFKTMVTNIFKVKLQPCHCCRAVMLCTPSVLCTPVTILTSVHSFIVT